MKLRIVGGSLSRRYISLPKEAESFRPTTERNRQAIAEILKTRLADAVVGDFCAGSGAMGFELLSRGAATVHFIDTDRYICRSIEQHCQLFKVQERCRVFCQDIRQFVSVMPCKYDIIYFDPPYDDLELASLLPLIGEGLSQNGVLLHEHRKNITNAPVSTMTGLSIMQTRNYGDSVIDFWARSKEI
jgi:16S rRNA (guanine966-N2)-methyltransferase